MDRLIHPALKGKPVALFSPTYKILADTWSELRTTLAPVIRDKSEQEKRLELINGGVIEPWSLGQRGLRAWSEVCGCRDR